MSKQTINIGASPNDGTGTPLRTSFDYTNQNFTEIYTALGGGVALPGATTQVIFNDGGTNLAGDAGLVYNKTTDALTVAGLVTAGSATITGAATVGTTLGVTGVSTLTGNAFANGSATVAAGTPGAFANAALTINNRGGVSDLSLIALGYRPNGTVLNGAAYIGFITTSGSGNVLGDLIFGTRSVTTDTAPTERYRIDSTGIATWSNVGGVAGTAMTLNSTGLGVGIASPAATIHGYSASGSAQLRMQNGTAVTGRTWYFNSFSDGNLYIGIPTVIDALTVTPSGNLGIGVTPSAWFSTWKVLQLAGGSFGGPSDRSFSLQNAIVNASGQFQYVSGSSTPASGYRQFNGAHDWYTAAAGTSPNQITDFSSPKMTLDASGNLLCGVTSAIFNSRLRVKTSSTSASDYGVYVADSADAPVFALRNDGLIYTGTKTASPYNNTTASAANVFVAADGTLGRSTSSLKYKKDVKDSIHGLADVLKLRSVTYKSKNGDDTVFGGLIAEEVHAAGLTEFVAYAPDKTPDSINYGNMVSLLVSAIKELTARVQTLEAK